jgi:sec-independent protein translocase protein TatB
VPGFQELLVIVFVALIVIGPNKLPRAATDAARLLVRLRREARTAIAELKHQGGLEGLGRDLRSVNDELRQVTHLAASAVRDDLPELNFSGNARPGPAASGHVEKNRPTPSLLDGLENEAIDEGGEGMARTPSTT